MMKADKGNTLVIMSRSSYEKKMYDFLLANNAQQIRFNFSEYNALEPQKS